MTKKKKLTWSHNDGFWTSCPILSDKAVNLKSIKLLILPTAQDDGMGYDVGHFFPDDSLLGEWVPAADNVPLNVAFKEADRWYETALEFAAQIVA